MRTSARTAGLRLLLGVFLLPLAILPLALFAQTTQAGKAVGTVKAIAGNTLEINSDAGGEITVSSTVKEYTETDPNFHFEERGEHRFKGVLGEHHVFAVLH